MTDLRTAAQQALEALEAFLIDELRPYDAAKTSAALRAALEEPVQEPVAQEQPTCDECGRKKADGWALYCVDCLEPMFAQRKPLTEEEIQECFHAARNAKLGSVVVEIARAIERAHGIGGQDEP